MSSSLLPGWVNPLTTPACPLLKIAF